MSDPFLAEIRIMSFNFPPKGWAMANGQFLPINQNQALFSLLGTTYGGNGQTTFALPNLRGRVPVHFNDSSFNLGQAGGEESHTVTQNEMPQHVHVLNGSTSNGAAAVPGGNLLASTPNQFYAGPSSLVAMNAASVSSVGGSQPHQNMQPYLVLNFCIALQGIFPSRN